MNPQVKGFATHYLPRRHHYFRMTFFVYSLLGESEPDVNIAVLPFQLIPALGEIDINCDADVAPFPSSSSPPLPPVTIRIYVGSYMVKECNNEGRPISECAYKLGRFFPSLPRTLSCMAEDALGKCRVKSAEVVLLSESG